MKTAIVTGADGFIGRYLVWELLKNGYTVYAVVMEEAAARAVLGERENLHFISCLMDGYAALETHTELKNIPLLFHFAWAGVSDAGSTDYNVQLANVRGACDMQTVAAKLGIRRLIFADSIMEWEHLKAFEAGFYQVSPRNTYHVCKITARNLLQMRAANMGMEFVPVVISNVYGVGENSPRLINTAIRKLLKREHMSFTPGEQLYDFIYITDAVRAIRLAAEKGRNNKLYYIGNRTQRPLKEYLYCMRDILAPSMELGIGELPLRGVSLTYDEIDTQGIFDDFAFVPGCTFAEGVRLTAQWIHETEK